MITFMAYALIVVFMILIMAKKMSSLIRKILSEVGRNEMLSWGYRIEKWDSAH